jgi:hypothetical protein
MKLTAGEVRLTSSDAEINAMLQRPAPDAVGFSRHFSQGEDFFIRLGRSFVVPSFSIHHDINENRPDRGYLQTLRTLIDTLQQLAPEVFDGLTYTFDPAEVLRPTFFSALPRRGGQLPVPAAGRPRLSTAETPDPREGHQRHDSRPPHERAGP